MLDRTLREAAGCSGLGLIGLRFSGGFLKGEGGKGGDFLGEGGREGVFVALERSWIF